MTDREHAQYLVAELKTQLPEVPEETCPVIDEAKTILGAMILTTKRDGIRRARTLNLLENLRAENHKLRELGREWYLLAKDLAETFPNSKRRSKRI